MALLIKGAALPKSCTACPYHERDWYNPKCHAKSVQGKNLPRENLYKTRAKFCPLIEVSEDVGNT